MKRSVGDRILLLTSFSLGIACLFGVIAISVAYETAKNSGDDMAASAAINSVKDEVARSLDLLSAFVENGDLDGLAAYNDAVESLFVSLEDLNRSGGDMESRLLSGAMLNSFESYYSECVDVVKARLKPGTSPYPAFRRAEAIAGYIELYSSQLLESELRSAAAKYSLRAAATLRARSASILALALFVAASAAAGVFISSRITKPIEALAHAAREVSRGNLDIQIYATDANDEIGDLSRSFGTMSDSIRRMVEDLRAKANLEQRLREDEAKVAAAEKSLRDARFLALQSQINPHFFFNTLNTISRLVMLRQWKEAQEVLDALAALLRYGLSNASAIASLGDEIDTVRSYAFIQRLRFGERVKVVIDCSVPEPELVALPRFTLQPLVENAIIHGLEPKTSGGIVRIGAVKERGRIVINVVDDGLGMDAARVAAIFSMTEDAAPGHTSSIGLSNVVGRLRAFASDPDCFSLKSSENSGTEITITLPERIGSPPASGGVVA